MRVDHAAAIDIPIHCLVEQRRLGHLRRWYGVPASLRVDNIATGRTCMLSGAGTRNGNGEERIAGVSRRHFTVDKNNALSINQARPSLRRFLWFAELHSVEKVRRRISRTRTRGLRDCRIPSDASDNGPRHVLLVPSQILAKRIEAVKDVTK